MRIGGLVGYLAGGSVTNSYSASIVSASGATSVGGLVGARTNAASVTASFWDTQASGLATSAAGTGEPTSAMEQQATFAGAGWDFVSTWQISGGASYPYLMAIQYPPAPVPAP